MRKIMEKTNRIDAPLRMKNLVPYSGLKDYCKRAGFYSKNEERDISKITAINSLGLAVYNGLIFGAFFAETARGLLKLLE